MIRPMRKPSKLHLAALSAALLAVAPGCVSPRPGPLPPANPSLPERFPGAGEAVVTNLPPLGWREFFRDPALSELIATALTNNQELNVILQEVGAAKAETEARKWALFPFVTLGGKAGTERASKNTRDGAVEENLDIQPGRKFPDPLPNYGVSADLDWEVDIWRKLRNERDAAIQRYLATREGRSYAVTHLVSEVAESYYELLSLDAQLAIFGQMVEVQQQALESVRLKKAAARVTELAVRRFEAEVLKNRSRLFAVRQQITETENRINFLTGRLPQPIPRRDESFDLASLAALSSGLPADLIRNRPDVRQAEHELTAAGLEVKAAAARFYPSLNLSAALGLESFTLGSPILAKENLAYGAAANLAGPLVNRSAIRAAYKGAQAEQVAAVYRYQETVLKAYVDVVNSLSRIGNLGQEYQLKAEQVQALTDSASLSSQLFDSARADYTEVLLTQREALEAKLELIETKRNQLAALVRTYKAVGGGGPDPESKVAKD